MKTRLGEAIPNPAKFSKPGRFEKENFVMLKRYSLTDSLLSISLYQNNIPITLIVILYLKVRQAL